MTSAGSVTKGLVLLVEDEVSLAHFMRMALEASGFDVVACRDGVKALSSFESARPEFVILDAGLPGQDGWTLCRQMRAMSSAPIIMMTAIDSAEQQARCIIAGADDCIAKPFDFDELLAKIEALPAARPV